MTDQHTQAKRHRSAANGTPAWYFTRPLLLTAAALVGIGMWRGSWMLAGLGLGMALVAGGLAVILASSHRGKRERDQDILCG